MKIFNLFKIKIPKDHAQEIIELESWTVTWKVKTGWSNDVHTKNKAFIDKSQANEFKKQLVESAEFIGAWILVEMRRN